MCTVYTIFYKIFLLLTLTIFILPLLMYYKPGYYIIIDSCITRTAIKASLSFLTNLLLKASDK